MASLPWLLSLAQDLDSLSFATAPHYEEPSWYYYRHPYMALKPNERAQQQQLRKRDQDSAGPMSKVGKDGFQVCMDVAQFKPSELNVKVVDNTVVVEGKHEEREDNYGYISRHFVRRYALPKGYEAEKVQSTLSSDGVLTINVPKPPQLQDKSKERIIQIQQVGPAHLNVKENPKEDDKKIMEQHEQHNHHQQQKQDKNQAKK